MRNATINDLSDRLAAAADARDALLRDYRAKMDATDPARLARQTERLAVATARDDRRAERDLIRLEEREQALRQAQDRIDAEAAKLQTVADIAAKAEIEAREKASNMIARVIKDEVAQKAERDRRYANRKARQH